MCVEMVYRQRVRASVEATAVVELILYYFSYIILRRIDRRRLYYLISTCMRYELKQCKLKGAMRDTTYETKRRDNSVSLQRTYGRRYNNIIIMNLPSGVRNKITAVHLKNKIISRVYVTEIVGRLTRYLIYYIFIYTTHTHTWHFIT